MSQLELSTALAHIIPDGPVSSSPNIRTAWLDAVYAEYERVGLGRIVGNAA